MPLDIKTKPGISEVVAFQVMTLAKAETDPVKLQRATALLADYKAQQESAGEPIFPEWERSQREELEATRKYFTDREKHGLSDEMYREVAQTYANDPEGKAKFFNDKFLARTYGKPVQDIRPIGAQYRDEYSAAVWGEKSPSDTAFAERLAQDFEVEDKANDWAQEAALKGLDPLKAQILPPELAENPAFIRREKEFRAQQETTYRATAARIAPYRQLIDETRASLAEKAGVKPLAEGETKSNFSELAADLIDVPKKDRGLVMAAIIASKGDEESDQADKGRIDGAPAVINRRMAEAQKLAENFGRGARDLGIDSVGFSERDMLQQIRNEIAGGASPSPGQSPGEFVAGLRASILDSGAIIGTGAAAATTPNLADMSEAQKMALAEIDRRTSALDISKTLRQISDEEIDPAKSEWKITQGIYDATRSLPYMAAAAAGVPGFIAVSSSLAEESYFQLREANPGISEAQALQLSGPAGLIKGALEKIPVKILQGRLPVLERFLNKPIATLGGVSGRVGVRAAGATALEMGQENLQDITPFVGQSVVSALAEDMPETPWLEVFGNMAENQTALFFATLPLALIGAGAGTYQDYQGAAGFMADYDLLRAAGVSEAGATLIRVDSLRGRLGAAQATLRAEFRGLKTSTQSIEKTRAEIATKAIKAKTERMEAIIAAEKIDLLPAIRAEQGGGYSLQFSDGTAGAKQLTYEEADAARWQYASDNQISIHEVTRNVIRRVDSQIEEGREVKYVFDLKRKTLADAVDEGGVSQAAAENRADIAEQQNYEADFQEAETVAKLSGRDRLASTVILGSNVTEFRDGVQRTVVRLYQDASPLTVIEEKVEGDVALMLKATGGREWLRSSLREYEQISGDSLFLAGKSDEDLTDGDLKEAFSDLATAYFVGRSRKGLAGNQWGERRFRETAAKLMRGKIGDALTGYGHFFRAVWRRAAKINRLKREGALPARLEEELARSTGMLEQSGYNQSVIKEAQGLLEELPFPEISGKSEQKPIEPLDDDAPFSVVQMDADYLAAVRSGDKIKAQQMIFDALGFVPKDSSIDRGGGHSPADPESGASAWNLTGNGVYPDDVYSSNGLRYYGTGYDEMDRDAYATISKLKGNANKQVTIYRAIEKGDKRKGIEPGAWVTTVKKYAKEHGESALNGKYRIQEKIVKAGEIFTAGDSWLEWGYHPQPGMPIYRVGIKDGEGDAVAPSGMIKGISSPLEDPSFSVMVDPNAAIAKMFSPFQRNPELRRKLVLDMQARAQKVARDWAGVIAANRSKKQIASDAKEVEGELIGAGLLNLSDTEKATIEGTAEPVSTPILDIVKRERMRSKSGAKKAGIDLAEYDDMPDGIPPGAFGGTLGPDQVAKIAGFENLGEFWQALGDEIESAKNQKEEAAKIKAKVKGIEADAKAEAGEFAKYLQRKRETVGSDRATLLGALRTLDAILSVLPPEVRGKIGGFVALAELTKPKAMLDEIEKRTIAIDRELERYLAREADKGIKKLFERVAKAKETGAGKKAKGLRNSPGMFKLFEALAKAKAEYSADEGRAEADKLQGLVDAGSIPADRVQDTLIAVNLIPLFSGWAGRMESQVIDGKETRVKVATGAGAAQKTQALEAATLAWKGGLAAWAAEQEAIAARREAIRERAIVDVLTTSGARTKDEQAIFDESRTGLARKAGYSLMSYDGLLSWFIGQDSQVYKDLVDGERTAANAYHDGMQRINSGVEDLFTALGRGSLAGRQLQFRMAQKEIKITDALGNELTISQNEAITALLMWRQDDGRRHMEGRKDDDGNVIGGWSYDQDFIDELSTRITPEGWEVYNYLVAAYSREYEPLNQVYRAVNGIDLPQNKNYSPITVQPELELNQGVDPLTGFFGGGLSGIAGSLRSRGASTVEPDFKDALKVFIAHSMQMEHYKAFAEYSKETRAILGAKTFRDAIERAGGEDAGKILGDHLEVIDQGGTRDAGQQLALSKWLGRVGGRLSQIILFGKLQTVVLNASQLGAAAVDMPAGQYLRQLSKLLTGRLNWFKALDTPYIRRRIEQMPPVVRQALAAGRGMPNRLNQISEGIGYGITGSDGLFTAGTYVMVLDHQRTIGARMGMTGTDLDTWARNETERIVDRVAQPTRQGTRSIIEIRGTVEQRVLWTFASESRKNLGLMIAGFSNRSNRQKAIGTAIYTILFGAVLTSLFRSAWRDSRDDEDDDLFDEKNWSPANMAWAVSTDWMGGVPFAGDITRDALLVLGGQRTFDGTVLDSPKKGARGAKNLLTWDYDRDEWDRVLADLQAVIAGAGTVDKNAASIAGIANAVVDAAKVVKNLNK
jgi:hypothetical protein